MQHNCANRSEYYLLELNTITFKISKLKAFAKDNLLFHLKYTFHLLQEKKKKKTGKGENAGNHHPPFSHSVLETFFYQGH